MLFCEKERAARGKRERGRRRRAGGRAESEGIVVEVGGSVVGEGWAGLAGSRRLLSRLLPAMHLKGKIAYLGEWLYTKSDGRDDGQNIGGREQGRRNSGRRRGGNRLGLRHICIDCGQRALFSWGLNGGLDAGWIC